MSESASRKVVETVAEAEEVDPLDLEIPLYEAVDPEALDYLFSRADPSCEFEFNYYGYRILVQKDDRLSVLLIDEE